MVLLAVGNAAALVVLVLLLVAALLIGPSSPSQPPIGAVCRSGWAQVRRVLIPLLE
jgi:hypothetical protein